jgi:AcrR family transcriptional regulator
MAVTMGKQDLVEQRRQQILGAAFKVFAELGYHNAGIADIAREVGTGHGTFYRYFANKRDILSHVLNYAAGRILEALADKDPTASNTVEEYRAQVEGIGHALFDLFLHDHQIAQVFFMQAMSVDREMTEQILAMNDAMAAVTEAYLKNGVEKGFLRADLDTEITAKAVNGMITAGAIATLRFTDGQAERDRWVKAVTALMFNGISGE